MMTFNNLNQLFSNIAVAHPQINNYGMGEISEIEGTNSDLYPRLWVVPKDSTISQNTINRTYTFIMMDLVDKAEEIENEVLSDTELILLDYIKIFKNESHHYNTINDITLIPFTENFGDDVSGWLCDITIETDYNNAYCDVPAFPFTTPFTPDCNDCGGSTQNGINCSDLPECSTIIQIEEILVDLQDQINNIPIGGTASLAQVLTVGNLTGQQTILSDNGEGSASILNKSVELKFDNIDGESIVFLNKSNIDILFQDNSNISNINLNANETLINHNLQNTFSSPANKFNGDIIMASGEFFKTVNGNGQLQLDYNNLINNILLSTDGSAVSQSFLYLNPLGLQLNSLYGSVNITSSLLSNIHNTKVLTKVDDGINGQSFLDTQYFGTTIGQINQINNFVSYVNVNENGVSLQASTTDDLLFSLLHATSSIDDGSSDNYMIILDNLSHKGLVYSSDYSANFTDDSLITKRYVNAVVASASIPTIAQVVASGNTLATNQLIQGFDQSTYVTLQNGFYSEFSGNENGFINMNDTSIELNHSLLTKITSPNLDVDSNIVMYASKNIRSIDGAGMLELDYFGSTGEVSLSTDGGNQSESYLYMTPSNASLVGLGSSLSLGSTVATLNVANSSRIYMRTGTGGFSFDGRYNSAASADVIKFNDNISSSFSTANSLKPSIVIASQNSTINSAVTNSVVIGGTTITASASNTVYVPNLNIGTSATDNTTNNLLLKDINNKVVTRTISSVLGTEIEEYFDAQSGTTVVLSNTPKTGSVIYVYKNGIAQRLGSGRDYTISGTTITFTSTLVVADIQVIYKY